MDEKTVTKILDDALLTDEEYADPDSWKDFNDPLPAWVTTE